MVRLLRLPNSAGIGPEDGNGHGDAKVGLIVSRCCGPVDRLRGHRRAQWMLNRKQHSRQHKTKKPKEKSEWWRQKRRKWLFSVALKETDETTRCHIHTQYGCVQAKAKKKKSEPQKLCRQARRKMAAAFQEKRRMNRPGCFV